MVIMIIYNIYHSHIIIYIIYQIFLLFVLDIPQANNNVAECQITVAPTYAHYNNAPILAPPMTQAQKNFTFGKGIYNTIIV